MLPFIATISMIGMAMSVFLSETEDWYLKNEMWYERELAYEFENFNNIMDRMEGYENNNIFEDTFEHAKYEHPPDFDAAAINARFKPVKTRRVVISLSSKPNNHGNSIFINDKKVLEATTQKVGDSVTPQSSSVTHEEPKARKF